jgi:hypothetical protein
VENGFYRFVNETNEYVNIDIKLTYSNDLHIRGRPQETKPITGYGIGKSNFETKLIVYLEQSFCIIIWPVSGAFTTKYVVITMLRYLWKIKNFVHFAHYT